MKKFTLFLAIMLCFGASVKAQTYVGEWYGLYDIMRGYFTTSGHPYVIYWDGNVYSVYESDFTTHLANLDQDVLEHPSCDFYDLDETPQAFSHKEEEYVGLTQALFNDDEYFEYFEYEEQGSDRNVIHVKSTNGNIVWTYDPGEGNTCGLGWLFKFDNNFYLTVYSDTGYDYSYHLYLIKQNQDLVEVESPLPISVFPTMPTREEQITVELGEGTNATEITVVNSLGQVVKRLPVEEGQCTVTIPARDLGSGLNVVNTRSNKGQGSCKIIVR